MEGGAMTVHECPECHCVFPLRSDPEATEETWVEINNRREIFEERWDRVVASRAWSGGMFDAVTYALDGWSIAMTWRGGDLAHLDQVTRPDGVEMMRDGEYLPAMVDWDARAWKRMRAATE